MGSSAHARLFYGIRLGDSMPELEETYCRSKGVPEGSYTLETKTIKDSGVSEICDGDHVNGQTSSYLAITGSIISADWDSPREIDPSKLVPMPNWNDQLRAFFDEIQKEIPDIEWTEPKFLMIADYG